MPYRANYVVLTVLLVLLCNNVGHTASAPNQQTFFIRAVAGLHGTISPAGWIRANAGSSQTFTIQPKAGYRIKDVRVDRVSHGPISTYTFNNIQAPHRIVAFFTRDQGQSDFKSAFPRRSGWFYRGGPEGYPAPVDTDGDKNTRGIEEGDIVTTFGTTLFVLNQYRGLQLIDIADSSNPSLLSTVPIYGMPVELYVRDGNAYVVVSNYLNCWYSPLKAETESFQGSRLAVVDVRNPESPEIIGGIDIEGFITDTRVVGNILYVVANKYAYYYYYDPADAENQTVITSISVADPGQVKIVSELPFPVTSSYYENNVHVTADRIFLSQYSSGYADREGNWVQKQATDITIIDISDAAGAIKKGATFSVPGVVSNRWQMDYYDGYFRAITPEQSWGNGYPTLYIYKIENVETVTPVSRLTLHMDRPEALMSVRFDGTVAYAVTYERKDPLFTIDLKDPAQPRQLAEIQMSGWIDYIEPKTDHLVTLGHDDAEGTTSLAVSLFDVTSIENPLLVQRVNFGEGYGWVPTAINDLHKAFKVLDDLHLIMVPFSSWSYINNEQLSGAQLIDYYFDENAKQLIKRGVIDHPGWIERALPYDDTTVMTVSNEAFQMVDISNRDKPEVIKALELARNSIDIAGLSQDSALELSSNTRWYAYDQAQSKLSVVPVRDPNTPEPVDALALQGYFDTLFSMQNCSLLSGYRYEETKGNVTVVRGVSYDGAGFALRGSLEITGLNNYFYPWIYRDAAYYYFPYDHAAVKKISDTALVYSGYDYSDENPANPSHTMVLKIVDAARPDHLTIAATIKVDLQAGFPTHTLWQGPRAYVSYAVPAANGITDYQYYYKCYFKSVDCVDIYNPTVSQGINIPGYVVGTSADGKYIYTIDYQYAAVLDSSLTNVYLNTLELQEGKAYLRDRKIIMPATAANTEFYSLGNVVVNNETAYYTVSHSACAADYSACQYDAQLVTANLSNPDNIQFSSTQKLQGQSADIIEIIQNKLFIYAYSGSSGIIVYSLANPLQPGFETFFRTNYYPRKIVVINNNACLPSGMYGVKVIPLQ